jgi:hypothetical protein
MLSQLHGLYRSIKHGMILNNELGKMSTSLHEVRKITRNHPVQYPEHKARALTTQPRHVDLPCKSV